MKLNALPNMVEYFYQRNYEDSMKKNDYYTTWFVIKKGFFFVKLIRIINGDLFKKVLNYCIVTSNLIY